MKRFLWVLGLVLLSLGGTLLAFDQWLSARIAQVSELASRGDSEEQNPSLLLQRIVNASEPAMTWQVTRIVLAQSSPEFQPSGAQWHLVSWLAWRVLPLHLSPTEQLRIYCSRVYVGAGAHGLAAASAALFGRPLSALSESELASVAALPFAPETYRKNPSLLAARSSVVLARAAVAP